MFDGVGFEQSNYLLIIISRFHLESYYEIYMFDGVGFEQSNYLLIIISRFHMLAIRATNSRKLRSV
jgi:hypothetical protein